ncbi:hypothetical protein OZX74_03720 [Bifidobacterium sp. ESL0798]|uniref:hypothetical protein n=1 Tax=Bifidobacterium sp. ESL0798 TaxID=2983235 RepID=UPI0023F87987|nr:hypothetical protein [Bifidobacterium sp. ESL0798]WEV74635.1 hypothetical protein OZX74_03720 [Bifidobacterium sp. ESL0798]
MTSSRKRPSRVTQMMVTQVLSAAIWPLVEGHEDDAWWILSKVVSVLEAHGCKVVLAYAIVHDRDVYQVWDYLDPHPWFAVHELGTPKPVHIHILIHLAPGDGVELGKVSAWLGLEPQYVEGMKQGKYGWDDALAYLTHCTEPWKHQYAPADVVTLRGPDYATRLEPVRRLSWFGGREYRNASNAGRLLPVLEQMAREGKITRQTMVADDSVTEVLSYVPAAKRKELMSLVDWETGHQAAAKARDMRLERVPDLVIWIHGTGSGSGKTLAAATIAEQLGDLFGLSVYDGPPSHTMDNYQAEDVITIDEYDEKSMRLNALLQLLDPYNTHRSDARYHQTNPVVARVTIVTSSASLQNLVYLQGGQESHDYPMDEVLRRIGYVVEANGYARDPDRPAETLKHGYDIYRPALDPGRHLTCWPLTAGAYSLYRARHPGYQDDDPVRIVSRRSLEYVGSADDVGALARYLLGTDPARRALSGVRPVVDPPRRETLLTDLDVVRRDRAMEHLTSYCGPEAAKHLMRDHDQTDLEHATGWVPGCKTCAALRQAHHQHTESYNPSSTAPVDDMHQQQRRKTAKLMGFDTDGDEA